MYERVVNKWNGTDFDHKLLFQSILNDTNIEKNEKLELISNVLNKINWKSMKNKDYYFPRAIFSSNDIELIDHLFKKIKQQQQIPEITISKLIVDYCHPIDKKLELIEHYEN
ncbi:hypothetical protein ACTFIY_007210 [Dictyostelium cf. discoideum]